MTALEALPLRSRLRAIDPARAALQSQVVEALNRRMAGGYLLEARLAADEAGAAWIILDAGAQGEVRIAPLLADGVIVQLLDGAGRPDAALAAVALGKVEPIVAAAELVIGRPLRPTAVVGSDRDYAVRIVVTAWRDGACAHRILLSLDGDMAIAAGVPLPFANSSAVTLAPHWTATIRGPELLPARLVTMAHGDLLLLGTGGNIARFTPPERTIALMAKLDVKQGVMTVDQELGDTSQIVAEAAPPPTAEAPGEVRVPTSIEFDGGGLSLERLSALGVGSVIAVPAAAGGVLPVRVLAGATSIATGELVAVGDGFGVLITALTQPPFQAQPFAQAQPSAAEKPQSQVGSEPPPRAEPQAMEA